MKRRIVNQATPRSQIVVGGFAKNSSGWLLKVDEAWVDDQGALRCKGHVVSRPLMAETLVRGETHPEFFWTAR
jgi:hypothetical protein